MSPRLRGPGGPHRWVALAVVAVVLGALFLFTGDRRSPGPSRLAATGATVSTAPAGQPGPTMPAGDPSSTAPAGEPGSTVPAGEPSSTIPAGAGAVTFGALVAAAQGGPPVTVGDGAPALSQATSSPAASTGESAAPAPPSTTTTAAAPASTTTTTATTTAPARSGPVRSPGVESEVVPLTNQDRTGQGLGSLSRNPCLDGVASGYAEQLARSGVLAHNPGAGAAVTDCRPNAAWGDNVGTATPCSASLLEEKWMASPSHRHNILTPDFQYIGVGAWTDEAGACWVQVLFSS